MGVHQVEHGGRIEVGDLGPEVVERGIRLFTVHVRRPYPDVLDPKLNVHSKLNDIMACIQATTAGADEALMLDVDGYVSEASGENLFIVTKGVVRTPPLPTVLAGITRASVLALLADAGIPAREERLTRDEIYLADEAFFTGTAVEVTPVRELDDLLDIESCNHP